MMAQNTTEYEVKLKNKMHMNVQVCTDGIFRVRFSPRDKYAENLMLRYNVQKKDWQRVDCNTTDKGGVMTITTGLYSLTIDKKDGSISVADKSGKKIVDRVNYLKGTDPLLASLGKDINVKFADMKVAKNNGIIGDVKTSAAAKDTAETGEYKKCSIINFTLREGERFYGGGSTSREHIQHRGELLRMWTTYQHTEIPQPMLISSNGWGVFNNTTLKHFFDIGRHQKDIMSVYNTTDEADFYLMLGKDMPAIIDAYTLITGRPYLQPKWAYGLCFGPNMLETSLTSCATPSSSVVWRCLATCSGSNPSGWRSDTTSLRRRSGTTSSSRQRLTGTHANTRRKKTIACSSDASRTWVSSSASGSVRNTT